VGSRTYAIDYTTTTAGIGNSSNCCAPNVATHLMHGSLKLRTVHFGYSTIIYENKVSKQNIFPWFKGTIASRPRPKFEINCLFQ
jgi:hypothetical protein